MKKSNILFIIVLLLYLGILHFYSKNAEQEYFAAFHAKFEIRESNCITIDSTLVVGRSYDFDIQLPNQETELDISHDTNKTEIIVDKRYSYQGQEIKYCSSFNKMSLYYKNEIKEVKPKSFFSRGVKVRVKADSINFVNIGKFNQVKIGNPNSNSIKKLTFEVEEGAKLSLKYLSIDTLILTSKCFSKIEMHRCKIGYLSHTVYGGKTTSHASTFKKVTFKKKNEMKCPTDYLAAYVRDLEADLANDPNLIFTYRHQMPPKLTNHKQSTLIKILR